ncbi:MAG: L-2-hydroxyglutarate oxidase [Proteobacteria bacterium]|nr:L-2-hydroxyglutarate oxidase [Pseudomonadota bacterium]
MQEHYDYLVVGAGIVGLATARRLQDRFPDAAVAVLEKEGRVATHQSGHNSGVIHAGVYYAPGSMKARLCRAGLRRTIEFCENNAVEYRRCGKLIVATSDAERERLAGLGDRATKNGCHCEYLDGIAIRDLEPNVTGVAALKIADTGIADYAALCQTLAVLIEDGGGTVSLNTRVESIDERTNEVRIGSNRGPFTAKHLIVCGGLQADRLARMAGLEIDFAIVPFRGDYYRLPRARSTLVSTLIYPVPDPRLPFLGVHLTLTVDGSITVGPTAMLAFEREAYRRWALNFRDAREMFGFAGTWRMLARFPRAGLTELVHAASRKRYLNLVRKYCPALRLDDLRDHECGIRAQAVTRAGNLIHDFLLKRTPRSVHVCNAPSPAATSAFPIADTIVASLAD